MLIIGSGLKLSDHSGLGTQRPIVPVHVLLLIIIGVDRPHFIDCSYFVNRIVINAPLLLLS